MNSHKVVCACVCVSQRSIAAATDAADAATTVCVSVCVSFRWHRREDAHRRACAYVTVSEAAAGVWRRRRRTRRRPRRRRRWFCLAHSHSLTHSTLTRTNTHPHITLAALALCVLVCVCVCAYVYMYVSVFVRARSRNVLDRQTDRLTNRTCECGFLCCVCAYAVLSQPYADARNAAIRGAVHLVRWVALNNR